jgi:hypothetical protein
MWTSYLHIKQQQQSNITSAGNYLVITVLKPVNNYMWTPPSELQAPQTNLQAPLSELWTPTSELQVLPNVPQVLPKDVFIDS